MVEVLGPHRVRIEVDAAEVRDPGQPGRVVEDDLVGRPAGRERELDRLEPVRPVLRGALLEEKVLQGQLDTCRTSADQGEGEPAGRCSVGVGGRVPAISNALYTRRRIFKASASVFMPGANSAYSSCPK